MTTTPPEPAALTACRAAMGLTATDWDSQITLEIAAARRKMQLGGVSVSRSNDDSDALVMTAIIAYVKGTVGNDNPDAERYLESFESMVCQMKNNDYYCNEVPDD